MFDWIEYKGLSSVFIFEIIDNVIRIKKVDISIMIIDIIFVVWFGVRDTKYENITNIPLM